MSEDREPLDEGGDDIDLNTIDADGNDIDDGGDDLDLGPDETGSGDEPTPAEPPRRRESQEVQDRQRPGRSARLAQQLRQQRSENADLARRLAALEQQRAAPAPVDPRVAAQEEAQFRDQLQNMLPHEAALAVADRERARTQAQLAQVALAGFDRSDTADYQRLRTTNAAAERLASRVEQLLRDRRAMGDYTLGRRDILAYLVGTEMLDGAGRSQQRRDGAARVANQQARPVNGRGDVAAPTGNRIRRSQEEADVALLKGVTTADF